MNEIPRSNQKIHVLFEHGYNEPCIICMESVAYQTDRFVNAFVCENVAYGYDVVTAFF